MPDIDKIVQVKIVQSPAAAALELGSSDRR